MKSEKLQFDRSLATDSEATYRLRTKSRRSLDAGIGGTFYSIPVDSYRNFRRILLYAAMRTISTIPTVLLAQSIQGGAAGLARKPPHEEVFDLLPVGKSSM